MQHLFVLTVRFLDDRYHGDGDWPPAPARLFQALLSATAQGCGQNVSTRDLEALKWLEGLGAPRIARPPVHLGRRTTFYVPNNNIDSVGGDPEKVAGIRAAKYVQPKLFDSGIPLHYVWGYQSSMDADSSADRLIHVANQLYQLGRGTDFACASAQVATEGTWSEVIENYPGGILEPGAGENRGITLECPLSGSLDRLMSRHREFLDRFQTTVVGRTRRTVFKQPSPKLFRTVHYHQADQHLLYELYPMTGELNLSAWPLERTVELTTRVRDGVASRLSEAITSSSDVIERMIIGRDAREEDKRARLRISPLPSIGHAYSDHAIRRVLVSIKPDFPLGRADLKWAFDGLSVEGDPTRGVQLVPAQERSMLDHYGISSMSRLWRTVTPAVLPIRLKRSARQSWKDRRQGAIDAVRDALRHAGLVNSGPVRISVDKVPYHLKGKRAEEFRRDSRFNRERLWHVELAFEHPVPGPLVIGDGRFLGLGILQPYKDSAGAYSFRITSRQRLRATQRSVVVSALRRAVMARVSRQTQERVLDAYFTGHERDGTPSHDRFHAHLFYFAQDDGRSTIVTLTIVAPHLVQRGLPAAERHLQDLESALEGFSDLRVAGIGVLRLERVRHRHESNPAFATSYEWTNRTPYVPTRHPKKNQDVSEFVMEDVKIECVRRGLPRPDVVTVSNIRRGPRGGIEAGISLTFGVTVCGPILLGRRAHFGGGLFLPRMAGATNT